MKTIEFSYGGKKLHLYFNGAAMFALDDMNEGRSEDQPKVEDEMQSISPQGFDALAKVAVVLAEQGELCRRFLQYPRSRVPAADELLQLLSPVQMLGLRSAVLKAIIL